MKIALRIPLSLLTIILLGVLSSCTPNTTQPKPTGPDSTGARIAYSLDPTHLPRLRTGEYYVAWYRLHAVAAFQKLFAVGNSRLVISGLLQTGVHPDTVEEARVTIESDTGVSTPGAILLGAQRPASNILSLSTSSGYGVADLTAALGVATFATGSADTTAVTHEFYLMQFSGKDATQSLQNLPTLAPSWHYAVWVTDSSFYPPHLFYYGAFLRASGHDSDSAKDVYPFPGGYEVPSLVGSNGNITVTIEPDFLLSTLKRIGPSPFTFLQGRVPQDIFVNEAVPLGNVAPGLPSATLVLTQR